MGALCASSLERPLWRNRVAPTDRPVTTDSGRSASWCFRPKAELQTVSSAVVETNESGPCIRERSGSSTAVESFAQREQHAVGGFDVLHRQALRELVNVRGLQAHRGVEPLLSLVGQSDELRPPMVRIGLESDEPHLLIDRQIALDAGPVVLVNVVTLDKTDEQALLKAWQADAEFMKRQPGFISTQLHRAIGDSPTYLNYAVWESTSHYRAAFTNPEFRKGLSAYPRSVVAAPHLFQKVAVSGSCVA
jgi:heme-degrading monooxygenase HmoA